MVYIVYSGNDGIDSFYRGILTSKARALSLETLQNINELQVIVEKNFGMYKKYSMVTFRDITLMNLDVDDDSYRHIYTPRPIKPKQDTYLKSEYDFILIIFIVIAVFMVIVAFISSDFTVYKFY